MAAYLALPGDGRDLSILALSLNLLIGYSGIFSLAHAAIYGIGAYASALVALKLGLGFWGGLVVAGATGALASALVAIPSLRVAGDYYIVASFGLQTVILTVFINWTSLTNGHAGLPGIPRPEIFGYVIDNPFKYVAWQLRWQRSLRVCHRLNAPAFGRTPRRSRGRDRRRCHRQERGARLGRDRQHLLSARCARRQPLRPLHHLHQPDQLRPGGVDLHRLAGDSGWHGAAGGADGGRIHLASRARSTEVSRHP
jgi:hypothetical protein